MSRDLDFTIAVHCAVIVHDNTPPTFEDDSSGYLSRLLDRHRRLLHFLEPFFHKGIQSNPTGFDDGVTKLWPEFCRQISSNWRILPSPNSRWISCTVGGGREVHYNLLTGKLLSSGKPLGRLPQEITKHPTYASVLGAVSIVVIIIHTCSCTLAADSRRNACYHPGHGIYDSVEGVGVSGGLLSSLTLTAANES